MWDLKPWQEAADREADFILEQVGYESGAVDAVQLARRIGCGVVFDREQVSRGRVKQFRSRVAIFLKPDDRPERVQWAASHEIGETLAHRVFQRVQIDPTVCETGLREHVANLLACRLLLPRQTFFADVISTGESLFRLKEIYTTASHELIALRLLDRPIPGCVTVIDQGRITKRRATSSHCSQDFLPRERNCWEQSHQQCSYQEHSDQELDIRCWPIHEEHWKREILITRPAAKELTEPEIE